MPRTFAKEGDVKNAVKKLLDEHKWFWFMPPANGYGSSGISDFIALRSGVFVAIETKFGKNTPSALQKSFLTTVMAHDGFAFVVNENTLLAFSVWLDTFDAACEDASKGAVRPSLENGTVLLDAIAALTAPLVAKQRGKKLSHVKGEFE
jgi:hypothetical protein